MKTDQPEKEFESFADAAARLLRRIEQRRGSGRLEGPEEFASPEEWSLVPGERGGSAQAAKNALELLPPVARRWACGGVKMRQGLELNVLFIQTHANLNDDDWLWN